MDTLLLTSDLSSTILLQGADLLCVACSRKYCWFSAHARRSGHLPDIKPSAQMQMKETMLTARTGQQQLDHLSAAACFQQKKTLGRYVVQVCVVQAASLRMICAFMLYNTCTGLQ